MGGSFNPVHIGHILLADYLTQFAGLDEVWLMLSPLNPLKECPESLIDDGLRLEMLRIATSETPRINPCDIELSMPRPSYTINSLNKLEAEHPDKKFSLVIGSDNWAIFDHWQQADEIISRFSPIIYPRPGYPVDKTSLPNNVTLVEAPVFDISSTFLRNSIAAGHNMQLYVPQGVWNFICTHNLYNYSTKNGLQ